MLRLGKGMLKYKGPMLAETDLSQLFLSCGGYYLKKIRLGYEQEYFIL